MVNPGADYNRIAPFVYSTLLVAKPGHAEAPTGELQGQLAQSWEVSPDGLTITMKMRPGVKWHNRQPVNGREMDMDDVMFSFDHYKELGPLASLVFNDVSPGAPVLKTEAPDASTLVMTLKDPIVFVPNWFACFGSFTGQIGMYPKEADGGGLDLKTDIIGTGPFMLKEHEPSVKFVLERHPDYWDDKAAMIDTIEMPIVPDYTSRVSQIQAGNIYYSVNTRATLKNEDILSIIKEEPRIKLYTAPYSTTAGNAVTFGHMPIGASKFQDERVRQAISMSWDRDLYVRTKFSVDKFEDAGLSLDTKWNSHLNYEDAYDAGGWFLDPQGSDFGENAKYFQYNLDEAKKLLSAAGYPDGFEVEVRYPNAAQYTLVDDTQPLIGFLQDLGLTVKDVGMTDYTQDYIPNNRDASGAFEGIAVHSVTGATPTHIHAISSMVAQHLPSSGVTFQGYDINGKGDKSGDPTLIDMLQKAQVSQDVETQKKLLLDAQRYLGKAMYSMITPGTAQEFWVAWPCVQNFNTWQGGTDETWEHYGMWIDPTQAPLA
jgi:ABC-type transport system substrate-binding protein